MAISTFTSNAIQHCESQVGILTDINTTTSTNTIPAFGTTRDNFQHPAEKIEDSIKTDIALINTKTAHTASDMMVSVCNPENNEANSKGAEEKKPPKAPATQRMYRLSGALGTGQKNQRLNFNSLSTHHMRVAAHDRRDSHSRCVFPHDLHLCPAW